MVKRVIDSLNPFFEKRQKNGYLKVPKEFSAPYKTQKVKLGILKSAQKVAAFYSSQLGAYFAMYRGNAPRFTRHFRSVG